MLSVTTQYALRSLIHLAQLPPATSILGRDLAARAGIPANYLAKILLALRNAGMVDAARGQGGGYRLAERPDRIRLVDVVDLLEGMRSRPGCFLGEGHECCDQDACSAHEAWKAVRLAYVKFLTTNTIADIGGARAPVAPRKNARKRTLASRPASA